MTLKTEPQWCHARMQYRMILFQPHIVRHDAAAPPLISEGIEAEMISVRCFLGRGHTGPHRTSVQDRIVSFRDPA